MKQIDAAGILDMAMSGTTATLLARRWESALLVNVDNDTLKRLMSNEAAMETLMSIEGFRSLNQDIETIINKSTVNKARKRRPTTPKYHLRKKSKRRGKGVQESPQADSGKVDQVRHPRSCLHVPHRLPGAYVKGYHHPIGTGAVQKGLGLDVQDF
ncbi:MAG: hypothetical protein R3C44_10265 [Chloroflexota bacterium]